MASACAVVPAFDRLNYYYGQLLGAADFLAEQRYFREKLKLHNRCLHGYGIVCGLEVDVPPAATPPATTPELQVECGLAIDAEGNELVVRDPIAIADVRELLTPAEKLALPTSGNGVSVWLTLCYLERGIEPNRPVLPDACGAASDCLYGRTREQVCVKATTTAPTADTRCACCATLPDNTCIVLARIDNVLSTTTTIAPAAIHDEVRRTIAPLATTIDSVDWAHGGTYTSAHVNDLLGIGANAPGLQLQFSGPVQIGETSPQGTVDVWLLRQNGDMKFVPGTLTWSGTAPPGMATTLTFKATASSVQIGSGDRVQVTVRSAVILDACCRPIDGTNVGGRIALLANGLASDVALPAPTTCTSLPSHSGSGAAINFESWFFVK